MTCIMTCRRRIRDSDTPVVSANVFFITESPSGAVAVV